MNLLYEVKDYIALITINRPDVRNSLNDEAMNGIIDALTKARKDDDVRVIIIRGAGDSAFCAGADLSMLGEMQAGSIIKLREYLKEYGKLMNALANAGKPTIAAVQGYALAGGCGLAVACDLTFASEKAHFGIPEINVGFWGMMITAPIFKAVGMKKGLELFYTGRHIDAVEAEQIGMVNRVFPHADLFPEVMKFAAGLAKKSPVAIKMGREAFYESRDMEYDKALSYLSEMVTILASSDDCAEGVAAFKEKRKPVWQGK